MVLIYQRGPRKRKPAPGEGEKTMKKKVLSLLLAIAMVCSLAACGGDKDPEPERDVPSVIVPKVELSEGDQEPDAEPEDEAEDEEEAELEPVVMNYAFEDGTLTCSGNGEIVRKDWIEVVKNAIFDPNETACAQALEALVIEPGVTGISDDAFSKCENLSGALSLPDSVARLGEGAFAGSGLTSADLPDGLTEIGRKAFENCESLTSVSLPKNLTEIPRQMFAGCRSLTDVEIPDGVTDIGQDAFYACSFETIAIPNSVTSIGGGAFSLCRLKSLTLPDSVTSIGGCAFLGTLLEELTIPAGVTDWDRESLCPGAFLKDITILCEASMDNVEDLLNGLFSNAAYAEAYLYIDYDFYAAQGVMDGGMLPRVTIHAPAGSVVEGYVKRELEKDSYKAEHFSFEAI